jgi:hypothetical protein
MAYIQATEPGQQFVDHVPGEPSVQVRNNTSVRVGGEQLRITFGELEQSEGVLDKHNTTKFSLDKSKVEHRATNPGALGTVQNSFGTPISLTPTSDINNLSIEVGGMRTSVKTALKMGAIVQDGTFGVHPRLVCARVFAGRGPANHGINKPRKQ